MWFGHLHSTKEVPYGLFILHVQLDSTIGLKLIASLDNVVWWHRNIERHGFCLNGFINHYPDFIVCTASGKIILVETKGDDRDNSDSRKKLKLGRKWADMAGGQYRYYMVFDENGTGLEGAYKFSDFVDLIKHL